MKIQGLAVIAIIIILPISIILNAYSQNQIKTLSLQTQYDSKLQNATYDAIKAFQLNMSNSATSDLANSKMRDIEASVNTFYNSLASNFNMAGYGEDVLKNYVPAIVYTLYDGYYIYSAYDNTLGNNFYTNGEVNTGNTAVYQNGENIYGLKPYIYYSCRYQPNDYSDFVITYSLDSYITIQGTINNKPVNEAGYLLTGVEREGTEGNYTYKYKGVSILEEKLSWEGLKEYVYVPGKYAENDSEQNIEINGQHAGAIKLYPCKKINGVKYYFENLGSTDTNDTKVFTMLNDEQIYQNDVSVEDINDNAIKYYEEAYKFKEKIEDLGLLELKTSDAVDENGKKYTEYGENNPFPIERKIFEELGNSASAISNAQCIEDSGSEFNAHRIEVIRNSIESNLMVAIANYNKVSTSGVNFQMPRLTDTDWETLTKNVSMITFLQGLSIGGKIYNGYSIVRNDITEDFVSEDSIYMSYTNWNEYYKVTYPDLLEGIALDSTYGIFNVNFERKSTNAIIKKDLGDGNTETLTKTIYYYPKKDMASYSSIINSNNGSDESTNIKEYLDKVGNLNSDTPKYELAQKYYTALGRERYGMYRVTNKLEEVQEDLLRQ